MQVQQPLASMLPVVQALQPGRWERKSYRLIVFQRGLILNEVPGQQVLAYQPCHCSVQGQRSEGRCIHGQRQRHARSVASSVHSQHCFGCP